MINVLSIMRLKAGALSHEGVDIPDADAVFVLSVHYAEPMGPAGRRGLLMMKERLIATDGTDFWQEVERHLYRKSTRAQTEEYRVTKPALISDEGKESCRDAIKNWVESGD